MSHPSSPSSSRRRRRMASTTRSHLMTIAAIVSAMVLMSTNNHQFGIFVSAFAPPSPQQYHSSTTVTTTRRRRFLTDCHDGSTKMGHYNTLTIPLRMGLQMATKNEESSSSKELRVGICGAGAIGQAMAALLAQAGHQPMLWSPTLADDNQKTQKDPKWAAWGALLDNDDTDGTWPFACNVASTLQELVQENSVIILALPANGHKAVMDQLVPLLLAPTTPEEENKRRPKAVIISSQASLGALYLSSELQDKMSSMTKTSDEDDKETTTTTTMPMIAAWATTVCTARQTNPTSVRINTIRKRVDYCVMPNNANGGQDNTPILQALNSQLFPQVANFCLQSNLFCISLANLNPQNHLAIALGNMSRMEKGETWYQLQHVTPKLGHFLEALDRERLDIAGALLEPEDLAQLKTLRQHFQQGFLGQTSSDDKEENDGDISDLMQQIYEHGKDVHGPNTADTRYVTEDVPFGLALTVTLGNLVQRPATLHQAGLQIMSAMYGRDFAAENDLIAALPLEGNLEELQNAVTTTGHLGGRGKAQGNDNDDEDDDSECKKAGENVAVMESTMITMAAGTLF